MLSGIKEFIFIINNGQKENFLNALGNINDLGINVEFVVQSKPRGLPDAFIIAEKLIKNESVAIVLGDNFFYGSMLSPIIKNSLKNQKGCNLFISK